MADEYGAADNDDEAPKKGKAKDKRDLSNDEIVALLDAEYQEALGSDSASQLRAERAKALAYMDGDMTDTLPSPKDRSKAVSTDVSDTVEGLMPSLMDVFFSGEETVVFNPRSAKDVQAAEQETDFVNYVWQQQNAGFLTGYTWFKDALISKVGIVKVWWEEREETTEEERRGLTEDELTLLLQDEDVEIVELESYPLGQEPDEGAEGSI